jgi:steroid delta-isomerase-like uncharacterized protein
MAAGSRIAAKGAPGELIDKEAAVSENTRIATRTYEAWNDRDFDTFSEVLADGVLIVAGSGDRFEGREGARQFAEMWANGFPDGRITIDNVVDGGDQVVIQFTGRGTQTGTLVGPMGEIPATNRPIQLQLCDVWQLENGTAKTVTTYFDTGSLLAQLGLMPEPATATA